MPGLDTPEEMLAYARESFQKAEASYLEKCNAQKAEEERKLRQAPYKKLARLEKELADWIRRRDEAILRGWDTSDYQEKILEEERKYLSLLDELTTP